MSRIFLFTFNKFQHMTVRKIILVHTEQKRAIDLVLKEFPRDSEEAVWALGYQITKLGEIQIPHFKPGIILVERFLDPKLSKKEDVVSKERVRKLLDEGIKTFEKNPGPVADPVRRMLVEIKKELDL